MPIIGLIIILVCFIGGGYWLVWEDRRYHARLGGTASEAPKPADRSAQDILAELRATLAVREETIRDLREKGGRLVVDRDRWEAAARRLEREIASLRDGAEAAGRPLGSDWNKFRELKAALANMFHPDVLRSASNFERVVREELYKEINAEIGHIEGRRRSAQTAVS